MRLERFTSSRKMLSRLFWAHFDDAIGAKVDHHIRLGDDFSAHKKQI
jgi:hypothetical protein